MDIFKLKRINGRVCALALPINEIDMSKSLSKHKETFKKGCLIQTKLLEITVKSKNGKPEVAEHPWSTTQCWPGELKKSKFKKTPETLYLSKTIPKNLIGQVVDNLELVFEERQLFLVKILTVINERTDTFWVLADELKPLENNISIIKDKAYEYQNLCSS